MSSRVSLLIMTGIRNSGQAERMMAGAREAITLDLVERALDAGVFRQIIVSTNSSRLAAKLADKPVEVAAGLCCRRKR